MKVIEFKPKTDEILTFLDEIKEEVKKNGIDNFIFTCQCADGEFMTGFSRKVTKDYGLMHSLIGNLQAVAFRKQIVEGFDDD